MKKYIVKVNGTAYEVEVEEIDSAAGAPAQVQNASPAKPAAEQAANRPKPSGKAGAVTVSAPMPGNILKINAQPNQTVKKGDVLCVLEAMKMENEIMSPSDGTVVSVNVQKGSSVNTGDVLFTLD